MRTLFGAFRAKVVRYEKRLRGFAAFDDDEPINLDCTETKNIFFLFIKPIRMSIVSSLVKKKLRF